jgi:hypothetical protein
MTRSWIAIILSVMMAVAMLLLITVSAIVDGINTYGFERTVAVAMMTAGAGWMLIFIGLCIADLRAKYRAFSDRNRRY